MIESGFQLRKCFHLNRKCKLNDKMKSLEIWAGHREDHRGDPAKVSFMMNDPSDMVRQAAEEHLNSWAFGSHQAIGCSEPRGAGTVVLAPDKEGPDWKQWSVRLARGYGIGRVPSR
ncbi:unnamed protein product [Durusdinium trenchii]|uniref:Uncharacterized protein n=1 Tax=Durusdinium trenchii TaxID=1381693 RepID=A0ABP0N7R2_9DINO